jgi:hypothetical protein
MSAGVGGEKNLFLKDGSLKNLAKKMFLFSAPPPPPAINNDRSLIAGIVSRVMSNIVALAK